MFSFHSAGPVLEHCNSLALDTGCSGSLGFSGCFLSLLPCSVFVVAAPLSLCVFCKPNLRTRVDIPMT